MTRMSILKSFSFKAAALLMLPALVLAPACSGRGGRPEEFSLEVTLGKTTPTELVKVLGPPLERSTDSLGRPLERLHFNVPYHRIIHVTVIDQGGREAVKVVRGKNVLAFSFSDGLLASVD
jgi:hypothetical protein